MTDKELIRKLNNLYDSGQSENSKQFIRDHEQRSLQLKDIIFDEFRYMNKQSVISGILLCVILILVSMHDRTTTIWCLSSFLPLFVLLMTSVIGRSERYGMSELEAACRFSVRFIRTIRMLIIGAFSVVMILICTFIAKKDAENSFAVVLYFVSFPFLMNVFSNLLITRKWHSKEDIYLCAGTTCFFCLMPSLVSALSLTQISNTAAVILIIASVTAVSIESVKYIKEENELLWNY